MRKPIEAAQAHFDALGRQHMDVPEWGTDGHPLVVYWSPLTIADRRRIFKGDNASDERVVIDVVVQKAEDEKGVKLFDSVTDEPLLMGKVDSSILRRLAAKILEAPSVAQATKNSEAISTS